VETGAISTASPANQCCAWRFYPQQCQKCPPMADKRPYPRFESLSLRQPRQVQGLVQIRGL